MLLALIVIPQISLIQLKNLHSFNDQYRTICDSSLLPCSHYIVLYFYFEVTVYSHHHYLISSVLFTVFSESKQTSFSQMALTDEGYILERYILVKDTFQKHILQLLINFQSVVHDKFMLIYFY